MRRRICGGLLESRVTDLPFKIGDSSIVILRSLPVLQCRQCGDTELEQATMTRVDQLLDAEDGSAELEVIRYAGGLKADRFALSQTQSPAFTQWLLQRVWRPPTNRFRKAQDKAGSHLL